MKRLLFLLFVIISFKSWGQYPALQTLGSDSTLINPKGAMKSRVINHVFVDTTEANTQRVKQYPGAQIFTSSDESFWLRNSTATAWLNFVIGSAGSDSAYVRHTNINDSVTRWYRQNGDSTDQLFTLPLSGSAVWGSITGTLSDQTDLQAALDAKQETLISGGNIKTINGASILGSGDLIVDVSDGDKGDITVAGGIWTIDSLAVTDAKINDVAWSKVTGAPSFVLISDTAAMLAPYQRDITLTTTGTSGPSTFISNTLNIPQYSGGAASKQLWVNLADYADSTGATDATAGINTAIAAVPVGGVLYVAGIYKTSGGHTINKIMTLRGAGAIGYLDYNTYANFRRGASVFYSTSASATVIDFSSESGMIENIDFRLDSTITPTTAIGLKVSAGTGLRVVNNSFYNFNLGIHIVNGGHWAIDKCFFRSNKTEGLRIENTRLSDEGDATISNSWFYGSSTLVATDGISGQTGIKQLSGGGLKIVNTKFNNGLTDCINMAITGSTSIILISNNSFENFLGHAIKVGSAIVTQFPLINGNQFAPYATITGNCVFLDGSANTVNDAVISNNIFRDVNSNTVYAVKLTNVLGYEMASNRFTGWTNTIQTTGSTLGRIVRPTELTTLTDGATVTVNANTSTTQQVTIGGNRNFVLSNFLAGEEFTLLVTQDGTGGWRPTFSGVTFVGSATINQAANGLTVIKGYATGPANAYLVMQPNAKSYTTTQRNNIQSPTAGTVIWNSTTGQAEIHDGSGWVAIGGGGSGTVTSVGLTSSDITVGGTSPITTSGTYTLTLPTINSNVGSFTNSSITVDAKGRITAASSGSAGSGWSLTGNAGTTPGTNYVGTSDGQNLRFKVNAASSGRIEYVSPFNTAFGYLAIPDAATGTNNSAFGFQALKTLGAGLRNTAIGNNSGLLLTSGNNNTFVGGNSGQSQLTTTENTFVGYNAGSGNTGAENTSLGSGSLIAAGAGASNTAIGRASLSTNSSGGENTAVGYYSLGSNATASNSTSVGTWSLYASTGLGNLGLGHSAGRYNTTETNRIYINTINRTNKAGDTTNSIIYGFQSTTLGNQYLKLGGIGGTVGASVMPHSTLHSGGSFAAGYVAKTSAYTATIADYTIDCTSGTFTVTLPTAVGVAGRIYVIVNSGAGTITVGTTSSQTFVNVTATPTTLTMGTLGTRVVQSNGANWILISSL